MEFFVFTIKSMSNKPHQYHFWNLFVCAGGRGGGGRRVAWHRNMLLFLWHFFAGTNSYFMTHVHQKVLQYNLSNVFRHSRIYSNSLSYLLSRHCVSLKEISFECWCIVCVCRWEQYVRGGRITAYLTLKMGGLNYDVPKPISSYQTGTVL